MPSWNEVLSEVGSVPNQFDHIRRKYIAKLSEVTSRNVILYYSGWLQKGQLQQHGYRFDIVDSDKMGLMSTVKGLDKSKGLDIVLHTPGGSIAATESIVQYLKSLFGNDIRAIIPQIAMSAGTMIALACKKIVLGKHSNLGPIDPQIGGLPTHGIIEEFARAKAEIKADASTIPAWQVILSKYNPTLIGECKKAIEWSEEMVKDWLLSNMFKDDQEKEAKVKKIIEELGSHVITKTHDRHIDITALQELEIKLVELEKDEALQDAVLSVHHASIITLTQTPAIKIIENQEGKAFIQMAHTK